MTNKLIEAMAWAIAERLEAFDIHGIPQAALKALSDAGYAVVPREPTRRQLEAAEHVPPLFTPSDTYRAMINATTTEEI